MTHISSFSLFVLPFFPSKIISHLTWQMATQNKQYIYKLAFFAAECGHVTKFWPMVENGNVCNFKGMF